MVFTLVTRRPHCPGRPKELCFTTLSLAMETMGIRLSVVKQSFFGPSGQYGRLVTRANLDPNCIPRATATKRKRTTKTATKPWSTTTKAVTEKRRASTTGLINHCKLCDATKNDSNYACVKVLYKSAEDDRTRYARTSGTCKLR